MSEGSMRASGSRLGPILLAVVFLAVLGGGAGYSIGALSKDQHTGGFGAAGGGGQGNSDGGTGNTGANTGVGASSAAPVRCPAHTENQAGAGPLTRMLYLHTGQSEVWICKDGNGNLYYQGHLGQPGQDLQEHVNALFLTDVQREGTDGYVATNTDQNGRVTEYHVTPNRLVKKFFNYPTPQPDQTEDAV